MEEEQNNKETITSLTDSSSGKTAELVVKVGLVILF